MTYKFNSKTHSTKIKAGMQAAKQAGKKLGRPKGGKIKGEDEVIEMYKNWKWVSENQSKKLTYDDIAWTLGVSKGTVQRIISRYKNRK